MNRVVKGAASGVSKRLLLTRVRSALANPKFSFPEDWNLRKFIALKWPYSFQNGLCAMARFVLFSFRVFPFTAPAVSRRNSVT